MGARNWIGVMELICGGEPWGRTTLDPGDGIDLCGCAMGARDTGWIGAMGLIHWDVPNDSVIWLLNLNDDTMCPYGWR